MAMQAQHIPANSMLASLRSLAGQWRDAGASAARASQDSVRRLMQSERFALGLGGVLCTTFVFLVVHTGA